MSFSLIPVPGADDYIRNELAHGRGLAHVMRQLHLEAGRVEAFLPAKRPDLAARFGDGALGDNEEEAQATGALVRHLVDTHGLTRDPRKVLICEFADGATERSDDAEEGPPNAPYRTVWLTGSELATHDGELWVAGYGEEADGIVTMLREALWFPAVALLTTLPEPRPLEHGDELRANDLSPLVQRCDAVLCGAWDAMNYLVWKPPSAGAVD